MDACRAICSGLISIWLWFQSENNCLSKLIVAQLETLLFRSLETKIRRFENEIGIEFKDVLIISKLRKENKSDLY